MRSQALCFVVLTWLSAGCDSRPIVMLGTLTPSKTHDAGAQTAAGRGDDSDRDTREHDDQREPGD